MTVSSDSNGTFLPPLEGSETFLPSSWRSARARAASGFPPVPEAALFLANCEGSTRIGTARPGPFGCVRRATNVNRALDEKQRACGRVAPGVRCRRPSAEGRPRGFPPLDPGAAFTTGHPAAGLCERCSTFFWRWRCSSPLRSSWPKWSACPDPHPMRGLSSPARCRVFSCAQAHSTRPGQPQRQCS